MKKQNFVTTAIQQPLEQAYSVQPKRTFNVFSAIADLYTRYTEWTARRDRVRLCKMAAEAFRTDMESAGALLFLFYGKTVQIDGDPYEERARLFAYLSGNSEQPAQIEQQEAPVHPAWTKAQLEQRAPMIEDYEDAFLPEAPRADDGGQSREERIIGMTSILETALVLVVEDYGQLTGKWTHVAPAERALKQLIEVLKENLTK